MDKIVTYSYNAKTCAELPAPQLPAEVHARVAAAFGEEPPLTAVLFQADAGRNLADPETLRALWRLERESAAGSCRRFDGFCPPSKTYVEEIFKGPQFIGASCSAWRSVSSTCRWTCSTLQAGHRRGRALGAALPACELGHAHGLRGAVDLRHLPREHPGLRRHSGPGEEVSRLPALPVPLPAQPPTGQRDGRREKKYLRHRSVAESVSVDYSTFLLRSCSLLTCTTAKRSCAREKRPLSGLYAPEQLEMALDGSGRA